MMNPLKILFILSLFISKQRLQKCCLQSYTKMECGRKVHAPTPLEILCYGGSHESR